MRMGDIDILNSATGSDKHYWSNPTLFYAYQIIGVVAKWIFYFPTNAQNPEETETTESNYGAVHKDFH